MLNNFAATQGGVGTDTVTTTSILDGTIANVDIASDAAIALSKLDGVTSSATELNLLDGRTIVGDCYGPGSATDNGIARFDGVAGKTIQNSNMTISDDPPVVKIGDGAAEDTMLTFDGNAVDYRIGLDDGNDTMEIGAGTSHGTTAAITIDSSADMTLGGSIACADEVISRPRFTDYSETLNAIGDTGGGSDTIDIESGNVVSATV
ncbi:MAG: hypothetical protein QF535_02920, partial [Anaerolineales bacterium]|nr:hypothetical protein [Anaerolineales bacterium]